MQCHFRQSSTLQRTGKLVLGFIAVGVAALCSRSRWYARLQLLSIFLPCTLVLHLPSVLPHHKQNAPLSAPSWPAHLWPRRKCPAICDRIEACMKNRSQFGKGQGIRFAPGAFLSCSRYCGQIGYLTPAVSGSPTAAERGTKSEVAHKVGKLATSPLPYRGAPPLQSGGLNQKWPTKWANWLPHPCRIGEPHRCRAGD